MEDFINYLVSKGFTSKKEGHFYRLWIINLYDFLGEQPGNRVKNDEIDRYISYISKSKMEWQVKQAQEAIRLYLYYLKRPQIKSGPIGNDIQQQWKTVAADMAHTIEGAAWQFLLQLFTYVPTNDGSGDHFTAWAIFNSLSGTAPMGEMVKEKTGFQVCGMPAFSLRV